MPKPYPREFREDVVRVARSREPDTRRADIAADFGISETCLSNRMKAADVEDGLKPGTAGRQRRTAGGEEVDPAPRARERGPAPCCGLSLAGPLPGKGSSNSRERTGLLTASTSRSAAAGCSSCGVSSTTAGAPTRSPTLSGTPPAWQTRSSTPRWRPAVRVSLPSSSTRSSCWVGRPERTVWKICSTNRWWSSFGKMRGRNGMKAGPPVHDDQLKTGIPGGR